MRGVYRIALTFGRVLNTAGERARDWARLTADSVRRGLNLSTPAGNRAEQIRSRPRPGLTWPLRGLLAASLAVPLLLLAVAAWQNYRLVQIQAEQRLRIGTGQLHEHAFSALQTYALVLAWIDDRTRGLDWER